MSTEARRIVAETYKVNLCPLDRAGEAFTFRPPAETHDVMALLMDALRRRDEAKKRA